MFTRRIVLAFTALLALPVFASAQALPDLAGRKVVVAVENAYFPLQFNDPKTGQAVGWEYDMMEALSKKLNFAVEYQNVSWDAMIQAVSDKQYDMGMTGITIKQDRMEKVDFSAPYMLSEIYMLVRGDEARFDDGDSFKDDDKLLIGAQAGTSTFYASVYELLDGDEQNPRIKLFETFATSVAALQTGDVDLVLTDSAGGNALIAASGGKLKMVGPPIQSEQFGLIFPKGSDLVAAMNAGIKAFEADGTFAAITQKWFVDYKP